MGVRFDHIHDPSRHRVHHLLVFPQSVQEDIQEGWQGQGRPGSKGHATPRQDLQGGGAARCGAAHDQHGGR